jgi:hypothetical protein
MKIQVAGVSGCFRQKTAWMRFVGSYSKTNQVQRLLIGALLICAGTAGGEKQNYLAMVGPMPLRFRVATAQYDPVNVLPPLKMSDAPATNVVETVTKPDPPEVVRPVETTEGVPEKTTPSERAPNVPVEQTPTAPIAPAARTEASQMTPQMLLRYFKGDGTREVVVPSTVEFTPPPPIGGSRSSAVYTSPPAK